MGVASFVISILLAIWLIALGSVAIHQANTDDPSDSYETAVRAFAGSTVGLAALSIVFTVYFYNHGD